MDPFLKGYLLMILCLFGPGLVVAFILSTLLYAKDINDFLERLIDGETHKWWLDI